MKLGLLTAPFPETDLMEVARWAVSAGFEALEIACWPAQGGEARRYAGTSHIDVDGLTASNASEIVSALAKMGIEISALGYYPNPLDPDEKQSAEAIEHLKKVITAAGLMRVRLVNTFIGGDRSLGLDENWEQAINVFDDVFNHAQECKVKLAFENCPMLFSRDEWPGGHNIAYSPRIWRRIFSHWHDVGMNFDPSHLVWQMIDQSRFIREFGSKIVHVHAKDLTIDRDGLYENGVMSLGIGWQVPKICGLGDVDWNGFFADLHRVGYDGPVIIEHEDRAYEGSDGKVKRGFELARDALTPYIR